MHHSQKYWSHSKEVVWHLLEPQYTRAMTSFVIIKLTGLPILLFVIVRIANHAGFSQTAVILTISPPPRMVYWRAKMAIITDTTQDVSKIDQLSQTFWYVELIKDDNGWPSEIRIRETFLGCHQCKTQMATDMTDQIIKIVEKAKVCLLTSAEGRAMMAQAQ